MQTGAEEDSDGRLSYERYWSAGRGDDKQLMIDMLNDRFSEAPNEDDDIADEAIRRRIYDLPMVWNCRNIAYFFGGDRSGKRTDTHPK